MSKQIAVRLPDEIVTYLDDAVTAGKSTSRAAIVTAALEREMRARVAQEDAEILRQQGAADDLDDLVAWSSAHAAPVED